MLRLVHNVPFCFFISFCGLFAATDSVDYGNNSMEWRSYQTTEPVVSFAEAKGLIWYTTPTSVGTYSTTKAGVKNVITNLGGVPTEGVKDVAVDNQGGIWFATSQGVAYTSDGKKFTIYTSKDGLSDDAISKLKVSPDGIWAGTDKGVSLFSSGTWKKFTTSDGLCGMQIRDIAINDGSTVWFATNNGIAVYKQGKWSRHDEKSGLGSNDVKAIDWDPRRGDLWAAVGENEIDNFDGKTWNVFMDVQPDITSIMVDTQGRVWVGSATGIVKYNGIEWIYDPAKMPFPSAQCNEMRRDTKGNLWFAIESGVIVMQNPYPY